jgi:hypothetical protein
VDPIRLYKAQGPDHVAVVSVQESWAHQGRLMISVARGLSRKLALPQLFGPYESDQVQARVDEIVAGLRQEGFGRAGVPALVEALGASDARRRALAALRLGWMREASVVPQLLAAAERNGEDLSSIVDALGAIGDARAVALARREAERKLLSRRRSGAEALRALRDDEGVAGVRERALGRLPDNVRQALTSPEGEPVAVLAQAVAAAPAKDRGLALDSLYELGSAVCAAAARRALQGLTLDEAFVWRYAKSLFKRAVLRHDAVTFGWLAHRIEHVGRESTGTTASVKSGYDGQVHTTRIFSRRTRDYMRRLGWRYLRRLARYRSELYTRAAAEAIVHYTVDDERNPDGKHGAYADCYLLNRVLWGRSTRQQLAPRGMRFRRRPGAATEPAPGAREEAFPELWDAHPAPYLRLLGGSRLVVVQEFAYRAVVERHRGVVEAASLGEVAPLLEAPYEPTVELGLVELRRRFDPANPDWGVVTSLLASSREPVRRLALEWLEQTARLWARDPQWCGVMLTLSQPVARETAATLAIAALAGASTEERAAVARALLERIAQGEPVAGAHDACARVAIESLAAEMATLTSLDVLVRWLEAGSNAMKSVAALLLGRREGGYDALGLPKLAAMARHELAAVRAGALAVLRGSLDRQREDPSALLEIADSDWPDSRAAAIELLRQLDVSRLSLDAILGVVDSRHPEAQGLGREALERTRDRWDPAVVVPRLLEHPHPAMRPFALDMAEQHLLGGLAGQAAAPGFFRAVLLDLKPSRAAKQKAIALLLENGSRSLEQARLAGAVLGDLLRSKTRRDFDDALEALAELRLLYPELDVPFAVKGGAR